MVPLPTSSVFQDDNERRYFDFFRSNTAPSSNSFVSSSFWSHIVFQTAHEEPTIRHAALALSAWHRSFEDQDESDLSVAVEHYNQALKHANPLLQRADKSVHDLSLVMTALILFHCIQNCFGDFSTAESSLRTSRKIAEGFQLSKSNSYMKDIILTISRLDIHAITFSDASAPYQFPEVFSTAGPDHDVPDEFEDIEHACRVLLVILKDSFHIYQLHFFDVFLTQDIFQGPAELATERANCLNRLRRWWDLSVELEERQGKTDTMTMALMRVYHTLAMIALCKGISSHELDWDLYMPHLVYILETVASILEVPPDKHPVSGQTPFSCELGVICPLFFVATDCRDPILRRRALELLAGSRRREGRWESIGAALVAQRYIEIEEEGLDVVTQSSDIPESKRIAVVEPRVSFTERKIEVSYIIPGALDPESMVRNEVIMF